LLFFNEKLCVVRLRDSMRGREATMFLTMMAAAAAACQPSTATNRAIVDAFYRQALVEKQPKAAFEKYVAADFVEHKPSVPTGTREATAEFLEGLIKEVPDPKWEVLRSVAEGDLVVLHVRFTPAPGAPAYAIADFFRVKDCKIVEHWDAVEGPPKEQVNPKPRF
jgi:predicted SnoaL-like aldol condensation-catalyzing enzyme